MKAIIKPSRLKGMIRAPASKSSMQRACAAALLRQGESIIRNPGYSNDDKAAIEIIKALGADVISMEDGLIINSSGVIPAGNEINCGESGLSMRMFTPIAALSDKEITIQGTGSLISRPMDFFDKVLPQLEVKVKTNRGKLPLVIKGPLKPRDIEIDGSISSQFLTGLLMAYAAAPFPSMGNEIAGPNNNNTITIRVRDLKSKPYIALTLDVMKKFGFGEIKHNNFEEFSFPRRYDDLPRFSGGGNYTVENDWSGAAFLLVAGAIAGPITVTGLDLTSTQPDKAIVEALMIANAGIAIEAKGIKVHPAEMNGFEFDATDCPDLFPPLVALAAYCKGETIIKGVNRLVYKESNRALTLWEEFGKMGVDITVKDDIMTIPGGNPLKPATVHSNLDHRIAMACTVAALGSSGETILEKPGVTKKSYPDFYNDLKSLGADVSLK